MDFLNQILSYLNSRKIKDIAKKHNAQDNRERKLTLMPYVLFTIFSSAIEEKGSYLPQIVTELKRKFNIKITKQAISKQMVKKRSWKVFRDLFYEISRKSNRSRGEKISKEKLRILNGFKDILIPDSSSFKVFKTLLTKYQSTHKGIAGCKLNTLFSFSSFRAIKVKITTQKTHDNKFKFVKHDKGVLYLFDLGYWSYKTIQTIIDRKSYFISRLKKSCDPVISSVNGNTTHKFVGKKLSEIKAYLQGDTIDLNIKLNGVEKEIRVVGILHNHEWYFYITNIFDKNMLPQTIYEIYRIRWQVELFFKWIKKYLNGKELCMRTDNSLLTEIYATLIYSILVVLLIDGARESNTLIQRYSMGKAINIVKKYSMALLTAIFHGDESELSRLLSELLELLQCSALKEVRSRENILLTDYVHLCKLKFFQYPARLFFKDNLPSQGVLHKVSEIFVKIMPNSRGIFGFIHVIITFLW